MSGVPRNLPLYKQIETGEFAPETSPHISDLRLVTIDPKYPYMELRGAGRLPL